MMRECHNCQQRFIPADLSKDVSKGIETRRKALGVQGILFRCYICHHCGHDNLFVDIHPLERETLEEFKFRREEMEATIRQSLQESADVTLIERASSIS